MGQFAAGKWIIGLTIYFVVIFLIVSSSDAALNDINATSEAQDVYFSDPGFNTLNANNSDNYDFNGSSTSIDYTKPTKSYSSFKASLSVLSGIRSDNVRIGMSSNYRWVFSILCFWIPLFMLLWAIYMAIPFFH